MGIPLTLMLELRRFSCRARGDDQLAILVVSSVAFALPMKSGAVTFCREIPELLVSGQIQPLGLRPQCIPPLVRSGHTYLNVVTRGQVDNVAWRARVHGPKIHIMLTSMGARTV